MTREEAINILKYPSEMYQGTDGIVGYTFNLSKRNYEAFQLAIKALEKEPCEDCVKREDVIQHICESNECYKPECKGRLYKRCWDLEWIYELPAVKPEHKRGKWIKYGTRRAGEQHYQCTHCKEYVNFGMWGDYYTKDFKYCPHCGAEME